MSSCCMRPRLLVRTPRGPPCARPRPMPVPLVALCPQVFYCWSARSDCVLEVECTGRWREAFDALKALGEGAGGKAK